MAYGRYNLKRHVLKVAFVFITILGMSFICVAFIQMTQEVNKHG